MNTEASYTKAQDLQSQGMHAEAAAVYQRLVQQSEDPRYLVAYGVCLQQLGRWKESLRFLQRGVDLKPHYGEGDARLLLADSLFRVGMKKKAVEQWKLLAAMEPEYPSYEAVPDEAKRKLREHDV
jgi:tetratricopeptide (TPR) repeat protein